MREYSSSGNWHLHECWAVVAHARARMAAGMLRAGTRDGRDGAQGEIDRLEFRRRNSDNPVRAAEYEIGARAFRWAEKNEAAKSSGPIKRGVGVASAEWHAVGVSGPEAQVIAHRDGSVEVRVGTQESAPARAPCSRSSRPKNSVCQSIG